MKEVFDVSYAAQRDVADGYHPVLAKSPFALNAVGSSTLLGKRQDKGSKSSDAVLRTAAPPATASPTAS
jgi:hypothetical protein